MLSAIEKEVLKRMEMCMDAEKKLQFQKMGELDFKEEIKRIPLQSKRLKKEGVFTNYPVGSTESQYNTEACRQWLIGWDNANMQIEK